jgi:hypothetical protein
MMEIRMFICKGDQLTVGRDDSLTAACWLFLLKETFLLLFNNGAMHRYGPTSMLDILVQC